MPKQHKKSDLPTKIYLVVIEQFTWRKKWERDWENVKYCSKACSSKSKKFVNKGT